MEDYGADGMRFGLLMPPVSGSEVQRAKLESSRNFANKMKNAAASSPMNLDGYMSRARPSRHAGRPLDVSRLAGLVARVDAAFDAFEFGEITRELYAFFWNEFCDWYIERETPPKPTARRASATWCSCSRGAAPPSCRSSPNRFTVKTASRFVRGVAPNLESYVEPDAERAIVHAGRPLDLLATRRRSSVSVKAGGRGVLDDGHLRVRRADRVPRA